MVNSNKKCNPCPAAEQLAQLERIFGTIEMVGKVSVNCNKYGCIKFC